MELTAAIQVIVKTFGLRSHASGVTRIPTDLSAGTTVRDLLADLRARGAPDDRLAAVHPDALLVLIDGLPIQYLDGWDTVLHDREEIVYMLKTAGG